MEDRDYTITKISEKPPREWNNPNGGIVYYRNVMLDGWDKPVSVGKKSPDALSVGMAIYGHPEVAAGMPEDKWKTGQKPFGTGQSGFGASSGNSHAGSSRPAYTDNSDGQRQGMCFNNAANWANASLSHNSTTPEEWAESVYSYANALYKLGDLGGDGGTEATNPKAPATRSTSPTTSSHKVDTRDPDAKLWPSDLQDEDPEFQSMLESGLQADGINLDDIPF